MSNYITKYSNNKGVEKANFEVINTNFLPKITANDVQNFAFNVAQIAIGTTFLVGYISCEVIKGCVKLAVKSLKNDIQKERGEAQRKEPVSNRLKTQKITTVTTTTTIIEYV
jgi:hypothetical protein